MHPRISKLVLYKGPKADHHFDCEDEQQFEGSPSGKTT